MQGFNVHTDARLADESGFRQAVYERVGNHLLDQNAKAGVFDKEYPDEFSPRYVDPDGRRCAIGSLISDEHYGPELEGVQVFIRRVAEAVAASLCLPWEHIQTGFLLSLQEIHDERDPPDWPRRLRNFAKDFNLVPLARLFT